MKRSARKSATMKRVVLFSLVLMGCPDDGPAGGSQASPHENTASLREMAPQPNDNDPACGALFLDEGCGEEVSLCEEPAQIPPTPEAVTP